MWEVQRHGRDRQTGAGRATAMGGTCGARIRIAANASGTNPREVAEEASASAKAAEAFLIARSLDRAINLQHPVAFSYREVSGRKTNYRAVPSEWHVADRESDRVDGEDVGGVARSIRYHSVRTFAIHRMRSLRLLSPSTVHDARSSAPHTVDGFRVGDAIAHRVFGAGCIQAFSGTGGDLRVSAFAERGSKLLLWKNGCASEGWCTRMTALVPVQSRLTPMTPFATDL